MAEDSEEVQPTTGLSDRASLHLGEDEGRLQGVQDALNDPWVYGKASPEEYEAYQEYRVENGERQSMHTIDRSLPVGLGEGFRNVTNWRDEQARRMFALDQGMADQDDARSPTMDSTEALFRSTEYLNWALIQTQQLDPEYAYELQLADRFLVMYPELMVTTRNGFGFAGISEQLGAELMGLSVPEFALQASSTYLMQSDIGDQFYTTFGDQLDPTTKDMLVVSLAGLSDKEQKRVFGLSAAYLDARPLNSLEDQVEFANWVAREASSIYATENDQSFWGKFGRVGAHVFTNPADWIQDEVLGSLWTAASDPADAWYRKELQLEETMALSLGHDVGTDGWNTFTGLAGAGIDIFIDPTNIALAGLSGLKAVRAAAMIDDVVRGGNRFRAVARQFVPFRSRKAAIAIGLPTGVRGRSSRILWTAFAKSHDGLIATARRKGVFEFIAESGSYANVIEEIPSLRNVDPGVVQMLIRRTDPAEIEDLYSAALRGSLLDPTSMSHTNVLAEEIDAASDVKRILTDLDPRTFTAGDVAAVNGGGMYHNFPVQLADKATPVVARAAKGAAVEVADDVIRDDVISAAQTLVSRIGDEGREVVSGRTYVRLGDGGVAALDDEGNVVGALIGTSVGVVKVEEGQGIGTTLIRLSGKTKEQLTAGTGAISEEGARVLNRAFKAQAESNLGTAMDPLAEGIVSYIAKGDTQIKNLNPGSAGFDRAVAWIKRNTKYKNNGVRPDGSIRKDALQAYLRANNIDVATVNGTAVFADLEGLRDAGKITQFAGGGAQHAGLSEASNRLRIAAYERRMIAPKGDTVSKWVISDMPTRVGSPMDDVFFWRKKFGVFSGKKYSEANFLVRKARGLVASVFLDDTPARIATGWANRQDGVRDLTRLLTQMNVDPDLVRRSIDIYMDDPSQAQVLQILRNAADDLGDEEIMLGLLKFNQKSTSELEYAVINKSEQLTSGLRVDGSEGLQPLLPSQTRQFVQLPEQRAFSAHIRRVKRATNRVFKSRNRGWGRDKANRQKIIDDFGATLGTTSEPAQRWAAMTMDEQFATAYAVVRSRESGLGDGLGYAAKFGQSFGESWGRLRNAFSVSMLAWRPIGWMGNEMLDNAWRASMADGLSFFTHPFRSVTGIHASRNIERAMEERTLYQAATAGVRAILNAADEPAVMLDRVAEIIPDVRRYVNVSDDAAAQAEDIRKFLNTELITNTDAIKVLDDSLAQALFRQRKGYEAAQKYNLPMNVKGELFNPNWDDVALTGMEQNFTTEVASASYRHEWALGTRRSPELLEGYTTAIGNVWARDLRDSAVLAYLEQVGRVGAGGTDNAFAARKFVNSGSWNVMEEPIRNMARFDGMSVDSMTNLELAEWYFKNKIGPYVDDIFGDVLTPDNVNALRRGGFVSEINGVNYIVDVDDPDTIADLIQAANGTNFKLPQSVVGVVNPRGVFGYGKEADGWKTPLKSYNQWALNKFGHELPAQLQRRPAFITTFKRYKENYIRLGMTEGGADFAANQKALEHVQKTFFFVEAQTPYLKKMNEIFPFFAAQYEIVKAWTWNIPAAQGGMGIGHARMLRTFDHVFTTLKRNGLLQPRYNRDGGVEGWDMQFASDPHTDNIAGQLVSRAGHLALMAPAILVEQIAEIFTSADLDLTPDEVNFRFNHPYEFFGRGGGILPTARMQFGLNPAMAYPASALTAQLPFTSVSEPAVVGSETNLELYLATEGVTDKTEFLTANRAVLLESGAVSKEQFMQLQSGTLGFSTITIPAGTTFMHPGTTLVGQFLKNLLHPYGMTDSLQEVISDYTPRVVSNMARTMGLWLNDGEDGAAMWLPNTLMGPTGRTGMGTARADAIIMLEMQTGVLTRSGEVAEEMLSKDVDSPEWLALQDELHAIDDLIAKETKEIAATRSFLQTVYGVIMPFNPKMPDEAATLRSYYHQSRVTAEQWAEGNPMPTPFDGGNARDAWSMVAAWAADDTGSAAKLEFLRQHGGRSSILAAIAPRTYWGGTGLPVWASDITEYFAQVEAGEILPLPIDVLRYKIRSMLIQVEREMIYIEEYGNDPVRQAQLMIQDGARHSEISELYDEKWRALEMEDEIVNDGAWAEHSLKVADNYVDFAHNNQLEIIEAMDIAMQEIELDLFPTDPQEARRMRGKLIGIRDSAYAAVDVYNDGRYADWEVSPRQQVMNEYWTAWGDYNDQLQLQYAKVEDADTGEELSTAYNSIARWRRENSGREIIIAEVAFASPSARSWNAMDYDHKKSLADAKLADKLEWLSWEDVAHIVEIYPEAKAYLPTTEIAQQIFDWKSDQDALLARKYRIGGGYIEMNDGSRKARDDHQNRINEEFDRRLRAEGEFGVLENISNYPIENFEQFGALPKSMEWLVPYAVAVHRQLDAQEKSPLSNAGHVQQRWVFSKVQEQFIGRPDLRDEFITWGMRVFQESTVEAIVAQLLGNYKGDLE